MMVISHHLFVLAPLLKAVGSFSAYIRTIDHGVTMMLCTNEIIYTSLSACGHGIFIGAARVFLPVGISHCMEVDTYSIAQT